MARSLAVAAGASSARRGKSTQQVGPADDSDNPVVANHRHTFDAMSFHQPRNLIDRRLFRDRHYLLCHHLLDLATMGMDILVGEPSRTKQKLKQARTVRPPGAGFCATQEVLFRTDAGAVARSMHQR